MEAPSSAKPIFVLQLLVAGVYSFYFLNPPEKKSQQKIGESKSKPR